MEATEVINPNGNIERTIVLNPEESEVVLDQISPDLANQVRVQLEQQNSPVPTNIPLSAEELERICDEAVGIAANQTIQTIQNIYPSGYNIGLSSQEYSDFEEVEGTTEESELIDPTADDPYDEEEYNSVAEDFHERVEEVINQEEPLEPIVYNTQLNSMTTVRFSGAEWFNVIKEQQIIIGGAGGISSWLALLLARANVGEIKIYDDDRVETVNLAGQFFSTSDIGDYKTIAIQKHLRQFADYYKLNYFNERYNQYNSATPIMMCGFDNMEARKVFFNNWKRNLLNEDKSKCLLLDGRLSAECLQVYCIQGDDEASVKYYQDHCLFSDEMADATVCSYKQTSFMANMIAATMVNVFVNWCANKANSFRPVPFFTEYDAVTMQYKLKMNAV